MRCSLLFVESRKNNEEKTHLNMHCRYVSELKIDKEIPFLDNTQRIFLYLLFTVKT